MYIVKPYCATKETDILYGFIHENVSENVFCAGTLSKKLGIRARVISFVGVQSQIFRCPIRKLHNSNTVRRKTFIFSDIM